MLFTIIIGFRIRRKRKNAGNMSSIASWTKKIHPTLSSPGWRSQTRSEVRFTQRTSPSLDWCTVGQVILSGYCKLQCSGILERKFQALWKSAWTCGRLWWTELIVLANEERHSDTFSRVLSGSDWITAMICGKMVEKKV